MRDERQQMQARETHGTRRVQKSISNRLAILAVSALLAGCTSMEGDLGRPEQGGLTEDLMRLGGEARAKTFGELYSDFNGTDEEKLMRDKAWFLIRPPHAEDWISSDLWNFLPSARSVTVHVLTETQRTRLTPVIDTAFKPKHYYGALRSQKYASHHTRYDRVITDIEQDRQVFAAFIPAAERVVAMDQERMAALNRLADMRPAELKDAYARIDENRRFIGWVWRAMNYRLRAYAYAIKRLEVETPSPKVKDANFALRNLSREVSEQNGSMAVEEAEDPGKMRKSRYTRRQWAKEDPNLVK